MSKRKGRQLVISAVEHLNPEQITPKCIIDIKICDELWNSTLDSRNQALQTGFVQGLRNASLDPTDFGGYMVQDSVYCFEAKGALDIAASKSHKIPGLKAFLEAQAKSYEEYYEDLYKEWHIKSANGICLNSACQKYVDELTSVAKDYDPIYLVAACIPCAKLWPWLGKELHYSQHNFGCYGTWVDENFNPTSVSYKKLEAFVNAAYLVGMVDEATLKKIYSTCMQCEADFFGSATASVCH